MNARDLVRPLIPGDSVRVYEATTRAPVERFGELGVVTGVTDDGQAIVRCDDGYVIVIGDRYRARRMSRLHDDTGLSTGAWRVRRKVLVSGQSAIRWVWIAEPVPARGIQPD
ncbi:hypothetical protein [Microbacterium sp. G2-8]|uniref:hypothetical protein n=1 Tax=Microbacterium sp. G2-8 TaxID=2842454 RepID=UPI001C8AF609|nr:hypothetical protein [Microbacterium sp. G2-8]